MLPNDVLQFWFEECQPDQWFRRNDAFDSLVRARFAATHAAAGCCELYTWRATAAGRLAEVIVLDQFSRNLFRDSPLAFASDPLALALAQEAVGASVDRELPLPQRAFLYMPFMHSESLVIHEQAERLFDQPGLEYNLEFERKHRTILERFGRYPHRNAVLGRASTAEELSFLSQPGSGF